MPRPFVEAAFSASGSISVWILALGGWAPCARRWNQRLRVR